VKGAQYQIIKSGRWRSGERAGFVWIIRQDWDYYYEEFYDEPPDVNEEGFAFYVLFGTRDDIAECQSRSKTCLSEAEAVTEAEASFEAIDWD
jgi:hypothetical protein